MISFRRVTMEDAENLLKWKNELDTRANSIVTDEIIALEDHLVWLEKTLVDKTIEFWIIELKGEPVGDLRLNHGETETEVSIRLDKKYRGKGLATEVVSHVRIEPGKALTAKIVSHNLASMRVFIANGFSPEEFVQEPVALNKKTNAVIWKIKYYIFRRRF